MLACKQVNTDISTLPCYILKWWDKQEKGVQLERGKGKNQSGNWTNLMNNQSIPGYHSPGSRLHYEDYSKDTHLGYRQLLGNMGPGRLYILPRQGNVRKNTAATHFPRSVHALLSSAFLRGWGALPTIIAVEPFQGWSLPCSTPHHWWLWPDILCQGRPPVTRHRALAPESWAPITRVSKFPTGSQSTLLKPRSDLTSVDGGGAWKGVEWHFSSHWVRSTLHTKTQSPFYHLPLHPSQPSSWGTVSYAELTQPAAIRVLRTAVESGKDHPPSHPSLQLWPDVTPWSSCFFPLCPGSSSVK